MRPVKVNVLLRIWHLNDPSVGHTLCSQVTIAEICSGVQVKGKMRVFGTQTICVIAALATGGPSQEGP
jgi:hypothetical protein